jgi:outer membrane protein assembly factor BamD
MGTRFRKDAGDAYARIVRDYPLSGYAAEAKKRLTELEMPIPQADPVAYNRMKWEAENRTKVSMVSKPLSLLKRGPDVSSAAKSGEPAMTTLRGTVPVSVPMTRGTPGFTGDVTATTVGGDASALDKLPDARTNPPAAGTEAKPEEAKPGDAKPADANAPAKPADATATAADPQQAQTTADPKAKKKKKDKKVKPQPATNPPATTTPATPPATQNPPGQP